MISEHNCIRILIEHYNIDYIYMCIWCRRAKKKYASASTATSSSSAHQEEEEEDFEEEDDDDSEDSGEGGDVAITDNRDLPNTTST